LKAFVTGATGLAGSSLCERLVRDGHGVRALVRPTSDTSFLDGLGSVELVRGDVTAGTEQLSDYIGDADTVFHTAALVDDWAERDLMVKVNVTALENLLQAARTKSLRRFVYISSLVVFGMKPQIDLDETAPLVHTGDNYNYTKILAEQVAGKYLAEGIPMVILRPPYIYGPRDRQFFPRLVGNISAGKFKFIGSGDNPFSLVYVGNLVEAMMLAAQRDEAVGKVFIITDGESITRRQLVELVCEKLDLEMPRRKVPAFVAKAAVPVLEAIYRLFHLKDSPIINRFKFKFMYTPLTFRIDRARDELGYKPVMGVREALELSLDWYRRNVMQKQAREAV